MTLTMCDCNVSKVLLMVQERLKGHGFFCSLVEGNLSCHVSFTSGADDLAVFDTEPHSAKWPLMNRLAKWTIHTKERLQKVTVTQNMHVGKLTFTMTVKDFLDHVIFWHPVHNDLSAACFVCSLALYVPVSKSIALIDFTMMSSNLLKRGQRAAPTMQHQVEHLKYKGQFLLLLFR